MTDKQIDKIIKEMKGIKNAIFFIGVSITFQLLFIMMAIYSID